MESKSIFISGAASGIGRATAILFHSKGWFVGCYDIDLDALTELKEELGDRCHIGTLDVRDKAAFDAALADFTSGTNGKLDLMFNNAGIAAGGFFDEIPFEKTLDMVNINLVGVLNGTHAAIPYLKETENSLCFTTSSSAAIYGAPGMATYGATKYAVKGFTHAMSVELARYGVRAADVMPGVIDTPLWQGTRYKKGEPAGTYEKTPRINASRTDATRTIAPSEVAEAVWNAYHDTRLHWYVPPELEDSDKATSADYEKRRDEILAEQKR